MNALEDWEFRMMELEEKLQPIAKRPVDITRPDWLERLQAGVQPLDEAGVRDAAERLLVELIGAYAQGTAHTRAAGLLCFCPACVRRSGVANDPQRHSRFCGDQLARISHQIGMLFGEPNVVAGFSPRSNCSTNTLLR